MRTNPFEKSFFCHRHPQSRSENKWRAVRKNIPDFVYEDLKNAVSPAVFQKLALCAALKMPPEQMKKLTDCTEGLENRIKAFAKNTPDYDELIGKVTTKRYIPPASDASSLPACWNWKTISSKERCARPCT